MFKLPNLGLFVTVFKAGLIVGVVVGAAAGALTGVAGGLLTAPMSGKKLRDKIKEDTEKGVQTLSANGEKLKEQGLDLMGRISSQFDSLSPDHEGDDEEEIETDEPLNGDHNQMSSRRKRRRSA